MTTRSKKWESGFLSDSDDDFENIDDNFKNTVDNKHDENYYSILGVEKGCSQDEIKKAYRKKSKELHPDKHMHEKEKYKLLFQELGEAYSILKDAEKRKVYDKYGKKGVQNRNFFIPKNEDELNMLFKMAFEDENNKNDKHAYSRKPQCPPIFVTKEITVSDSCFGGKIHISVPKSVLCRCCTSHKAPMCNDCKGKGEIKSYLPGIYKNMSVSCELCNGTGKEQAKHNKINCTKCEGKGIVSKRVWGRPQWIQFDCTTCDGSGVFCNFCSNTGYSRDVVDLPVTVTKGIKNGGKQVLYRLGHEKKNYENGDIVITYKVTNDKQTIPVY